MMQYQICGNQLERQVLIQGNTKTERHSRVQMFLQQELDCQRIEKLK